MQIANSIWYRNTETFNASFLRTDSTYFDATVTGLDFSNPSAVTTINNWVNSATHGKIPSIVDHIDPFDVMFLINAIYFDGGWRTRFDPTLTQSAPFHAASGDETVSMMHQTGTMSYAQTSDFQAVDLPYGNSAFTMTVIVPDSTSTADAVAASLTPDSWRALTASLAPAEDVDLALPKFTVSWQRAMIPDLQALGMQVPFVAGGADFTPMSPDGKNLYISSVQQRALVDVNEQGTVAAAVTSVGITAASLPAPKTVHADHPFIFVIRERLSGTVLFLGKISHLP
jgi:serpin B